MNGVIYGRYRLWIKQAESNKVFEIWSGSWQEGYALIAYGTLSPKLELQSIQTAYKKRIPPAVIRELERRLAALRPN